MDLIAIGLIAVAFSLLLAQPGRARRRRRRELGLKPLDSPRRENWTWPSWGGDA